MQRCRALAVGPIRLLVLDEERTSAEVVLGSRGDIVRRYNWHSAGSVGWPFPMLKYEYIFRIKYTEAILSNSARKLSLFELITEMLIAVKKINLLCYFIIVFGTLSFPICATVRIVNKHRDTGQKFSSRPECG